MSISSVSFSLIHLQFSSVMSDPLDPTDCSTPSLPVHHQLPELTQTHVHWVGDAIQPSHPLLSPSLPDFNLSSIRIFSNESGLCIRWPKYWNFSLPSAFPVNIQDRFPLGWTGWISQESSPTPQFKNINSLVLSFLYTPTLTSIHDYWRNHSFDYMDTFWQSNVFAF